MMAFELSKLVMVLLPVRGEWAVETVGRVMDTHVIKVHAIDSQKSGSYQHVRHSGRDNRHRTALDLPLVIRSA